MPVFLTGPHYTTTATLSGVNDDYLVLGSQSYLTVTGLAVAIDIASTADGRMAQIDGRVLSTTGAGIHVGLGNASSSDSTHNTVTIGVTGSVAADAAGVRAISDHFHLSNHGNVSSATNYGVSSGGSYAWLENHGAVSGASAGVSLGGSFSSFFNYGNVTAKVNGVEVTGRNELYNAGQILSAFTGVHSSGDNAVLENSGTIQGRIYGVFFGGGDANKLVNSGTVLSGVDGVASQNSNDSVVHNSGVIEAVRYGLSLTSTRADGVVHKIVNSGTIKTEGDAIRVIGSTSATSETYATVANSGTIIGNLVFSDAARMGGSDVVRNTGDILGDITFGSGADTYRGASGTIDGTINGDEGNDTLIGGAEDNIFNGGADNDTLNGRGGDDTLNGDAGDDTIRGGAGEDTIDGGDDNDTIRGGAGDDDIQGGSGEDNIRGGAGDDTIDGGLGRDTLRGGAGNDTLNGFHQWDVLIGGKGDDVLTGGFGNDTFVFGPHDGHDRITDFVNGQDRIDLSALGLNAADYATVVAPALSGAGANVTLLDMTQLGGTGTVRIEGLAIADADVSDFIF